MRIDIELKLSLEAIKHSDQLFEESKKFYKDKNYLNAIEAAEKAINLNRENFNILAWLGVYYRVYAQTLKGEAVNSYYLKSEDMLSRAIQLNPEMDGAYYNLALNYNERKLFDKSIETCLIGIEILMKQKIMTSNNSLYLAKFYNLMAQNYVGKNKITSAITYYTSAISKDIGRDSAFLSFLERGRCYLAIRLYYFAIVDFQVALNYQKNVVVYEALINAYLQLGSINKIMQLYDTAAQQGFKSISLLRKALVSCLQGNSLEASSMYSKIQDNKRSSFYYLVGGLIALKVENIQQALTFFTKCYESQFSESPVENRDKLYAKILFKRHSIKTVTDEKERKEVKSDAKELINFFKMEMLNIDLAHPEDNILFALINHLIGKYSWTAHILNNFFNRCSYPIKLPLHLQEEVMELMLDSKLQFKNKEINQAKNSGFKDFCLEMLFKIYNPVLKTRALLSALILPETAWGKIFSTARGKKPPSLNDHSGRLKKIADELQKTDPKILDNLSSWLSQVLTNPISNLNGDVFNAFKKQYPRFFKNGLSHCQMSDSLLEGQKKQVTTVSLFVV